MRIAPRMPGTLDTDHELLWTAVGLAVAASAWLVFASGAPVPVPRCLFKAVTGWPCPTCGGTRALQALLALDMAAALRLNPLVTGVIAGWTAYAIYALGALTRVWPRLRVELGAAEQRLVRTGVTCSMLATWLFLVLDGR